MASLPKAVPVALAKEYEGQMAAGNLVFLTDGNQERLRPAIPDDLWAQKKAELDAKVAQAKAPRKLFIKDAWECPKCQCTNAGELAKCADCLGDLPAHLHLVCKDCGIKHSNGVHHCPANVYSGEKRPDPTLDELLADQNMKAVKTETPTVEELTK